MVIGVSFPYFNCFSCFRSSYVWVSAEMLQTAMGHGSNKYHSGNIRDPSALCLTARGFFYMILKGMRIPVSMLILVVHGRTLLSVIIRFTRKLNQFFWHFHLNIIMTPWLHTPLGPILWVDGFSQHQKEQLTYFCRFLEVPLATSFLCFYFFIN